VSVIVVLPEPVIVAAVTAADTRDVDRVRSVVELTVKVFTVAGKVSVLTLFAKALEFTVMEVIPVPVTVVGSAVPPVTP
jgi:hypothetical protein